MKRTLLAIATSLACLPLLNTQALAEDTPAETNQEQVLVVVGDHQVTNIDFAVFAAQLKPGQDTSSAQVQVALLNELVNTMMVAQSEEARILTENPEIKSALAITRARLLAQAVIREQMQNAVVEDADIQAAYDTQFVSKPGTEFKARHILLTSEEDAKAVIAELDKGADFATLAKEKSTGPSNTVGGDLGWFEADKMVAPFSAAVAELADGSYSKSPVQTQFGWHVILREESRAVPVPSLDDVRMELEKELRRAKVSAYINALRDKTHIEIKGQ